MANTQRTLVSGPVATDAGRIALAVETVLLQRQELREHLARLGPTVRTRSRVEVALSMVEAELTTLLAELEHLVPPEGGTPPSPRVPVNRQAVSRR
jgi:hypothetical protein